MSWQDVRADYMEQDDEPAARTIPANPRPGQRFMRGDGNEWGVYERDDGPTPCDCHDPLPQIGCVVCGGRGSFDDDYVIAEGLPEADARLLVFGPALVAAAGEALSGVAALGSDWGDAVAGRLSAALADVKAKE